MVAYKKQIYSCFGRKDLTGRVANASDCYAGGKSGILPLLKHACGEQWLQTLLLSMNITFRTGNIKD